MKNKKFAKIVAIVSVLVLAVSMFAGCANDNDKYMKDDVTETVETVDYVLTDFVSGLKDWTVEVGAQNIDFMKDVEYNKEVVKEVTVDDSKVNLTKEGRYDLVYSIVPLDNTISKETVTKTVTVKVVSVKEAQKEADAGKQVATSNNEVKKDSSGKTPEAPKQEKPAETPKKPAGNNNGNSNSNTNNSKPSTGNNKPSGNTGNNKPADNNKPSGNTGSNSNNQGNDNSGNKEPAHKHSYSSTVTTQPTHTKAGVKTYTCKCGDHYTESIPATGHNWKDVPAKTHTEYKTETYTEQVPRYKWVGWYECNECHEHFDTVGAVVDHDLIACGAGYSYKKKQVSDGYDTVTKEKKVPYEVVDDPAHKECSCGARQ